MTTIANLLTRIDHEVGCSPWLTVEQDRIDAFADVTDDHQFIHVDPAKAADTPFGGTIAHGFLSLSLLAPMSRDSLETLEGAVMGMNYGFDKVRFLNPVRAGARVRGRFVLRSVEDRGQGRWLLRHEATVEIEGDPRPALIAEWLTMQVVPL